MSGKIVVGYDGSPSAKRALDVAKAMSERRDASLVIAHVLEWSPYSFLTPTELEERHMRRKEELARAEDALIKPLLEELKAAGIEATAELRYGHSAETLCKIAEETNATQVVIGRTGTESSLASRVFGSVAGSLAQASPVPVTIVP